MQLVNNSFNKLKMNGSTHVHMLTIEVMWKKSLTHFITCVLINYGKCKMQPMNNDFNV